MRKSKKVEIWMKVGEHTPVMLEVCRNMEVAMMRVERYQHQDRREMEDGYGFPNGIPVYELKEV